MLLKLKNVILKSSKTKNLLSSIIIFLNKFLPLPNKISRIAKHLEHSAVFRKANLKKSDFGYWYLDPMPSDYDLDNYYTNIYWDNFHGGKNISIESRSIEQYQFINEFIDYPDDKKDKSLLNFGAGEGGISYLFSLNGWRVVNVEPSEMLEFEWEKINKIEETNEEFDLIISSHSLEHVNNLDSYVKLFIERIKEGGLMFIEVPNCEENNEIVTPHTYYFTEHFFRNYFPLKMLDIKKPDDVIRYIGQK